jgi:hypothetical protein
VRIQFDTELSLVCALTDINLVMLVGHEKMGKTTLLDAFHEYSLVKEPGVDRSKLRRVCKDEYARTLHGIGFFI